MSTPTITYEGHLVVAVSKGRFGENQSNMWRTSGRIYTNKPSLSKDEVAVKIKVELPVSLFVRPQLEARIQVPAGSVTPVVLDLEVLQEALQQHTGFNVTLVQEGVQP